MKVVRRPAVIVDWEKTDVDTDNISMTATVTIKLHKPDQNEHLLYTLEQFCEESGQQLKRIIYKQAIELADYELVMSQRSGREGKGIRLMGKRRFTIKTIFGTVRVYRIRIQHKADKVTEIPSAKTWKTPRQVCLSAGLRTATCDTAAKESYRNTVKQLERRSGEARLISKTSVKNIMHREGENLRRAQTNRAKEIYITNRAARALLGRAEGYLADEFFEQVWLPKEQLEEDSADEDQTFKEEMAALFNKIEWDPREVVLTSSPSPIPAAINNLPSACTPAPAFTSIPVVATAAEQTERAIPTPLDEGLVVVQPDEVVVRSQHEGEIWLRNYNGVVIAAGKTYYFTALTTSHLFYQVGSLLATLGVGVEKRLLVISDGAAWIRRWVESMGIAEDKLQSVLCWYHLKKHCSKLLREAIKDKAARQEIKKALYSYLWRGQVSEARAYLKRILTAIEDNDSQIAVDNVKALMAVREYLLMRQQHIPDYFSRLRNKQWIASTKIEKYNDWSVSSRCKKKNGMKWTSKGVGAIAALEAARRNNELGNWREQGELYNWQRVMSAA